LNFHESLSGSRLHNVFLSLGLVNYDLPFRLLFDIYDYFLCFPTKLLEIHECLTFNRIFLDRLSSVGMIDLMTCLTSNFTGIILKSSGCPFDGRLIGYQSYSSFFFNIFYTSFGDCLDRYLIRINECFESSNLVVQVLNRIPVIVEYSDYLGLALGNYNFLESSYAFSESKYASDTLRVVPHPSSLSIEGLPAAFPPGVSPVDELRADLVSSSSNPAVRPSEFLHPIQQAEVLQYSPSTPCGLLGTNREVCTDTLVSSPRFGVSSLVYERPNPSALQADKRTYSNIGHKAEDIFANTQTATSANVAGMNMQSLILNFMNVLQGLLIYSRIFQECPKGLYSVFLCAAAFPVTLDLLPNDFMTVTLINRYARNVNLPDLIAILGSIDFVLGSVDS
jgi:hypothetical protein